MVVEPPGGQFRRSTPAAGVAAAAGIAAAAAGESSCVTAAAVAATAPAAGGDAPATGGESSCVTAAAVAATAADGERRKSCEGVLRRWSFERRCFSKMSFEGHSYLLQTVGSSVPQDASRRLYRSEDWQVYPWTALRP